MAALSECVVVEFCKLCGWAYETWLNHRELFDDNPKVEELQKSWAGPTLARLNVISQEYSLLQIAKLHDAAVISDKITLTIDYVATYGAWRPAVLSQLEELQNRLNKFGSQIRSARNKLLSHNDFAAVVSGATLGAFRKGEDEIYFQTLQQFVNVIHEEVVGGPWPFNDLVKNDVVAFLTMLNRERNA